MPPGRWNHNQTDFHNLRSNSLDRGGREIVLIGGYSKSLRSKHQSSAIILLLSLVHTSLASAVRHDDLDRVMVPVESG